MVDRVGKELEKGDLLIIAQNGNYLEIGIFNKIGSASNINYYSICQWNQREIEAGKKLKNSYVNTTYHKRWQVVSTDILSAEELEWYKSIKNYMFNGSN